MTKTHPDEEYHHAFLILPLRHTQLTRSLYLQESSTHNPLANLPWPALTCLPALPQLYHTLTSFTLRTLIHASTSTQAAYERVRSQLYQLKINLQIERQYAGRTWHCDKRRLQASAIHFTLLLRSFLAAIIPQDCRNILDAHHFQHACFSLPQLEKLINSMMGGLQQLHQAMIDPKHFREEQSLTVDFFKGLSLLFNQLPTMSRQQIMQVPPLMQYVVITLQIEQQKGGLASIPQEMFSPLTNRTFTSNKKVSQAPYNAILQTPAIAQKKSAPSTARPKKSTLRKESCDETDMSRSTTLDRTLTIASQGKSEACFPAKRGPVRRKAREVMREGKQRGRSGLLDELELERPQNLSRQRQERKEEEKEKEGRGIKGFKMDTGRPKGWQLVRQSIYEKIALRQIEHLLHSE